MKAPTLPNFPKKTVGDVFGGVREYVLQNKLSAWKKKDYKKFIGRRMAIAISVTAN